MTNKKKNIIKEEQETKELKEQLMRALADYDNLKKRVEKERFEYARFVGAKLIGKILPIYDMLVNAARHSNDSGLAIILGEFDRTLGEEGVEKIRARVEDKFNEQVHEVVEVVEGKGTGVVEEVLTGWKFKDGPVIRPAKVKVYKHE